MANNIQTEPKFKVGEAVILQCLGDPKFNGEYTIIEVELSEFDQITWYYNFGFLDDPTAVYDGRTKLMFPEYKLSRKFHPGEMSFDELMKSLKSPITDKNIIS